MNDIFVWSLDVNLLDMNSNFIYIKYIKIYTNLKYKYKKVGIYLFF